MVDNRLTFISMKTHKTAMFKCVCGNIVERDMYLVRTNGTRSCGCFRREVSSQLGLHNKRHGMSQSAEYKAWSGAKSRCHNDSNKDYPNWGGRGITMCPRWLESFEAFLSDVGPRPSSEYSLDRINNDGNYEPGNVRWATDKEQNENRRVAILPANDITEIYRKLALCEQMFGPLPNDK